MIANSNEKSQIILFDKAGKENVMRTTSETIGDPLEGEVKIRHKAIGINFIDIYHRSGTYPLPMPSRLGLEASGIIEDIGEGVSHLRVGQRVAYASMPLGAYCDVRIIKADQICALPDSLSFQEGAAIMLKGLTVEYLFHRTTELSKGDTVLFHAAAGGVGLIACQWARSLGIKLIATAGSNEKCNLAILNGATHVINYKTENFVEKVKLFTDGKGVDVVMDSVGKDTFENSLDCLKPLGMMVSFGNASGKVPPFDLGILQSKGSLKITRPTLFNPHIANKKQCQAMASNLFRKIQNGEIKITIGQSFSFNQFIEAHKAMQSRNTVGSTVINL